MNDFQQRQLSYGIGLTGSIACGKSTVGRILKDLGFLVVDADQISREAVSPNSIALKKIAEYFGKDYLLEDGSLDRRKIRERVFAKPEDKKKLEEITHPEIARIYQKTIEQSQSASPYWFYEASLLVELKKESSFKELWVANCPQDIQIERLMKRDSISRDFAIQMINAQMPAKEKIQLATRVIDTNKSIQQLTDDLIEIVKIFK